MPESLGEQVQKWYCPTCISKDGDLVVQWRPVCAGQGCVERVRSESMYCSEACAITFAASNLKKVIPELPVRKTRFGLLKAKLDLVRGRRPNLEQNIRALECRQLLIDECIDRIKKFIDLKQTSARLCGFDERICSEWILTNSSFTSNCELKFIDEYFSSCFDAIQDQSNQENQPPSAKSQNAIISDLGLGPSVCLNENCDLHDSWELVKSREVELELQQAIEQYYLDKQDEIEAIIGLLPRSLALELANAECNPT